MESERGSLLATSPVDEVPSENVDELVEVDDINECSTEDIEQNDIGDEDEDEIEPSIAEHGLFFFFCFPPSLKTLFSLFIFPKKFQIINEMFHLKTLNWTHHTFRVFFFLNNF